MKRLLPHPGLTLLLVIMWMLVLNSLSVGGFLLGLFFAIVVPLFTAPFWPDRPQMRLGLPLLGYAFLVLWDIVVANFQVAWLILFRRNRDFRSCWLSIPLELRSAEAITLLAGTISLTPGTVSTDISTDGRHLLVHALDTGDPAGEINRIKVRYERRLLEIFR
ncbi:Na+/H+ antiporter subunit E [Sphingobium sp. Ant17]|jgi:multicomponent K+:H+ antiporter subunit E|uniref:Na+/H+ antiporter subunit E n=1 Tax=Sphingobium sp. Ant17 TaxID=1461752 RepID=UPI00044AECA6|nr:Na+/H+ antiporter subunit E [Sphingobium sp. Ant17]EXS68857.1 cation:proton antiporter [Sphingobium sp. Ant17]OHC92326.1 MAG: Na+/H+ antiporter subunit E [Sphingomonadales bacterium GWF1_63_6]OHC95295.1 MAG: Na+/H+ antiporter subunit E [Sphingomonadales bacterium RIFCSPLOWO2_12_FULL_63_15]|tara:strand:- start:31429 stop:31917 length:489 start_codon:yes stop_codon:yes gene_type:complete